MPIRSSVCAYGPLSSAGKYSPSAGRLAGASVLPASSTLSYGQYRPLGASSSLASSPQPHLAGAAKFSSSRASYSPSSASSSGAASPAGHYRPLSSSARSSLAGAPSARSPAGSSSASYAGPSRYSVSNLSLASTLSAAHERQPLGGSARHAANQSSSAYSSGSLTSSASSAGSAGHRSTSYHHSALGASLSRLPASRRLSYTSRSSMSSGSIESYQTAQQEQLPDGVPSGLVNLGNTCYMNATLQALYSIESFRNLLLSSRRTLVDGAPHQLSSELGTLFIKMRDSSSGHQHARSPASPSSAASLSNNHHYSSATSSSSGSINPVSLRQAFAKLQPKFSNYGQQDAQEFLRYLVNAVHEEANKASRRHRRRSLTHQQTAPRCADDAWHRYQTIVDDSPFVELLVGQFCSTITCSQCQHKSHCWDPFWDLSLPLVGSHQRATYVSRYECSLNDLIAEFTAKETLDCDERPKCEKCNKPTKSTKQIGLSRLPKVLILHLKKFTNDGYKLSSPDVRIEPRLTFADSSVVYQLKACVSHHGHSSSSGHYTSHCEYSGKWIHFDDDRVRDVSQSFSEAKLNDAYVLFYTRSSHHSKL